MQDAIRLAVSSADGRDVCNGWLAAIIAGQAPDGVAAPPGPAAVDPMARFGQAAAALWFSGASAEPQAADEACAVLAVPDALDLAESLMGHGAENVATWVLAGTPDHLRPHASSRMLPIIAAGHIAGCEALRAYLTLSLPGKRTALAAWLSIERSA